MQQNFQGGQGRRSLQSQGAGLATIEEARQVARRLYDQYDTEGVGYINNLGVCAMISDVYKSFKKDFQPNKQDIDSYSQIIDTNKDGRVTHEDLVNICIKYLCE